MKSLSCCRLVLPVALAALCCSCSTPEERADAAWGELIALAGQVRASLASVVDAESAEQAVPVLSGHAEALRDVLEQLDELGEDPDLPQEARRRLGKHYHAALKAEVEGALKEANRVVVRHRLYNCKGLERLARMQYAHYGTHGVHPWPRAVLSAREYRPQPCSK